MYADDFHGTDQTSLRSIPLGPVLTVYRSFLLRPAVVGLGRPLYVTDVIVVCHGCATAPGNEKEQGEWCDEGPPHDVVNFPPVEYGISIYQAPSIIRVLY